MKKISIIEDLIPLFPSSPFQIYLDNRNEQKNICVISENLGFEYSDELKLEYQKKTYTAEIGVYISADEQNANFYFIYSLLEQFFDNVRACMGFNLNGKQIILVTQQKPFGYLGRDKSGNYTFILNFNIEYKL